MRVRTTLFTVLLALLALAGAPAVAGAAGRTAHRAAVATPDPTTEVNPFIGTENFGNTFPGASLPFGMVQVSPDNGAQGGYDYSRNHIYGFSRRTSRASAAASSASFR